MLQFSVFVISHYAALLVLLFLSYGAGRELTRRVEYRSELDRFVVCSGLGLGVLALLLFFVGLLGALSRPVVGTGLALLALASWRVWRELAAALVQAPWRTRAWFLLAGAIAVAASQPVLMLPLYPPTGFDAIMYHLPYASTYAESHRVSPVLGVRYPVFPQAIEMLFALALLLFDDILAQLIHFLTCVLVSLALYVWGARQYHRAVGVWAASLWFSSAIVMKLAGSAFIDLGVAWFATLAVYAAFGGPVKNRLAALVLAGAFAGFTAGSKYSGLFFIAALAVPAIYAAVSERTWRPAVGFAAAAFAAGAPWYLYNWYQSGNPVFPFLGRFFGPGFWSTQDVNALEGLIASYGPGYTFGAMLRLPWSLSFGDFPEQGVISPIYFAALPVLWLAAALGHRVRPVVLLVTGFIVFWFWTVPVVRYLIPILPAFGLAIAVLFDDVLRRLRVPAGKGLLVFAAVSGLLVALPGWRFARETVKRLGLPPVTQAARDSYLQRQLVSYDAYQFLNATKGSNYAVYALYAEDMVYYAKGRTLGDWLGPGRFAAIQKSLPSGEALYRELRSLQADHFLVRTDRAAVRLPDDPFFQSHFKLVQAGPNVQTFELTDTPIRRVLGEELLTNPGFEDMTGNRPTGWKSVGSPETDASGNYSRTGNVAIRCDGPGQAVSATVRVTGGGTYVLFVHGRSAGDLSRAWLQLTWTDSHGQQVGSQVETMAVEGEWKEYRMSVLAPLKAASATLLVIPHPGQPIWLDDLSLVELRYEPVKN